jgi:hypothetical protein
MHLGVGAEGGYDSNVFYSEAPIGAAIYRATMFGQLSNASRTGAVSRQLSFDVRAGLQYRRYQFIDDLPAGVNTDAYKDAWMPTAGLAISVGSGQVGFGLADTFVRMEDAPYAVGQQPIVRDNNQASAEVRWSPGGGRLTGVLRYTNMIDIFETDGYSYANSDTNQLMLDIGWKWLPKTAVFLDVQQGYITYLNDADAAAHGKTSSYPLRATAGLRGLLTARTSAILSVGYVNAFYSGNNVSTGGFLGSTYAELAFTLRPTFLSRVVAGYRHDFENTVIATFSYNETVYVSYVQQIASRLALDLSGRYVYRNYQGFRPTGAMGPVESRTDNFFQAGATLDYFVRNWIYAGVGYAIMANDSTVAAAPNVPQVDYLKQQVFVRLGVTY